MVQEIEISRLYLHPKNVRKHYDGIEELAESIKEKGILQNLTVVPGHFVTDEEWEKLADEYAVNPSEEIKDKMNAANGKDGWSEDGYTVVIGNRRLTAARLAGIETAPCVVSDMTEKEQVSTMLLENMQRKDLTAYEESSGFQMCLDLGMTEDELSQKTGLSKKTIKHRTKMQLLDQDKVEAACADGATIFDFIKLEQIKDIKKRNEVLESLGTPNFNYRLEAVIREEKKQEAIQKAIAVYEGMATRIYETSPDLALLKSWYNDADHIPTEDDLRQDEPTELFYLVQSYCISLYKKREIMDDEPDEQDKRAIERAERDRRNAAFEELGATFYGMRKKHLLDSHRTILSPSKIDYYMTAGVLFDNNEVEWRDGESGYYCGGFDDELYRELYGIDDEENVYGEDILKKIDGNPIHHSERIIYCMLERGARIPCKDWNGRYKPDLIFEYLYSFLQDIGYRMSEEEMQIIGGTHKLYLTEEDSDE